MPLMDAINPVINELMDARTEQNNLGNKAIV
jgi:hypothetical protein